MVVILIVLPVLLLCIGFPLDLAWVLLSGSVTFLWRVIPQLQVRWDLVISTCVYALLLAVGAHFFLRWLYARLHAPASVSVPVAEDPRGLKPAIQLQPSVWRVGWTLRAFAIVLLMFISGTAMVGMTHQTVWLARSPEPMFRRSGFRARRIYCASNLRQIGMHLYKNAARHGGVYPDDFRPLVLEEDFVTLEFICPESNDEHLITASTREAADSVLNPEHNSYLYFGKGLKQPVDANQIIAMDKPGNHGDDGINVLFGDGRVEWQEGETMRKTLEALKLSTPMSSGSTRRAAGDLPAR